MQIYTPGMHAYRIAQNFDGGNLTDTDSSNIWRKIFWRIVTVFYYTPVNAKQFDGLNIDGLAGKHQKHQNFALYGSLQEAIQIITSIIAIRSMCKQFSFLVSNKTCYNVIHGLVLDDTFVASWLIPFDTELLFIYYQSFIGT